MFRYYVVDGLSLIEDAVQSDVEERRKKIFELIDLI